MTETSNPAVVQLGIMSTASISPKNVGAMKLAKGVAPISIGSRDLARAKQFAAEYGVERAVGSYDELLDDDDLDGIYIPLPTVLHREWVAQTLAAGKHILCEKPVAENAQQLHQMLQQSLKANLAFMDGVMFVHHDRMKLLREVLKTGTIGKAGVRYVNTVLTFRGDESFFAENIRVKVDGDPLGCLGDLGWYNVRLALWAFDDELPIEVRGVVHSETANGVPTSFSGSMKWADDDHVSNPADGLGVGAVRTSTFYCSFTQAMQQCATLAGDEGFIELDDFVIPKSTSEAQFSISKQAMVDNDKRVDHELVVHTANDCIQEVKMWEHFSELVRDKSQRLAWMRACLANQLCIDALLESARNGGKPVKPDPENLIAAYSQK